MTSVGEVIPAGACFVSRVDSQCPPDYTPVNLGHEELPSIMVSPDAVNLGDATSVGDAIELMFETGWTDGLPVVPPTEDRVKRFVDYTGLDGQELIAELPPLGGKATVERIAVNAVMAGCLPEHMPVVLAALQAMMEEGFNLRGVMASTGIHTPLVIVSGPLAEELDINSGYNCFGSGWRSNATIGRAVKLVLVNLGGATPGDTNKATFGHPGSYTYCVAEDQEANPWAPLHTDVGLDPMDSAVTVFPAEAPHNIMYHAKNDRDFLSVLADTMCTLGNAQMYVAGDTFVCIGPVHAQFLHEAGWRKQDIRQFLFEHARKSVSQLKHGGPPQGDGRRGHFWPKFVDPDDDAQMVPVVRAPDRIHIMVAGGSGGAHSVYLPGWGSRRVTRKIDLPRGA